MLCRVICPRYTADTISVPTGQLIFHGSCSSMGLLLISAVQLCVSSPTGSTQPPLSHLPAVPQPLFCRAVLHAGKATTPTKQTLKCLPYPNARSQLGGISFWDFQFRFLPSAAALPHSLDSPQHCYWRGLCKYMQPRAHFGINQSKLKLMNKKYRNRSSNKAISLSFPLCLSFFFKKAGFFSLCFFGGGEKQNVFLVVFFF